MMDLDEYLRWAFGPAAEPNAAVRWRQHVHGGDPFVLVGSEDSVAVARRIYKLSSRIGELYDLADSATETEANELARHVASHGGTLCVKRKAVTWEMGWIRNLRLIVCATWMDRASIRLERAACISDVGERTDLEWMIDRALDEARDSLFAADCEVKIVDREHLRASATCSRMERAARFVIAFRACRRDLAGTGQMLGLSDLDVIHQFALWQTERVCDSSLDEEESAAHR